MSRLNVPTALLRHLWLTLQSQQPLSKRQLLKQPLLKPRPSKRRWPQSQLLSSLLLKRQLPTKHRRPKQRLKSRFNRQ